MRRHQASTFYRYGINSDANDARHMRAPFIIVSEGVRERERKIRTSRPLSLSTVGQLSSCRFLFDLFAIYRDVDKWQMATSLSARSMQICDE